MSFLILLKIIALLTDLQHFSSAISILDELAGNTEIDSSDGELYSMLKELGNFSAELYFSLKTLQNRMLKDFAITILLSPIDMMRESFYIETH